MKLILKITQALTLPLILTQLPDLTNPPGNKQREVSVHKTEVLPNPSYESHGNSKKTDDCNNLRPVHKKPHALLKCRAFREKPIEERRTFQKENNISFKGCASSTHLLNNVRLKCNALNAAMRITTQLFTQEQKY